MFAGAVVLVGLLSNVVGFNSVVGVNLDLIAAFIIANRIETNITEEIKNVDHILIHYEPTQKENLIYAIPIEDTEGKRISEHFGEALHFILVTVRAKDKRFVTQEIIENPFTHVERGKGILVAEFLVNRDVDVVITKETFEGKGPAYVFSDAAVEVLIAGEDEVKKTLSSIGVSFENTAAEGKN